MLDKRALVSLVGDIATAVLDLQRRVKALEDMSARHSENVPELWRKKTESVQILFSGDMAERHYCTTLRLLLHPEEHEGPWIPTDGDLDLGHEDCSVCEELRVVGPDHRNTLGADHDEGCSRSC